MTKGIIKTAEGAGGAARVRTFPVTRRPSQLEGPPQPAVNTVQAALRQEVSDLTTRLEDREAQIAQHGVELERALKEGETNGYKAGLLDADMRHDERLARLEAGIERALTLFADQIALVERLAPTLAIVGLEKILGDCANRADFLQTTIRNHLQTLDEQAIVGIDVAHDDFGDPAALAQLQAVFADRRLDIRATDHLRAGGCRIRLTLGVLDIGIDQQWGRLSAALMEMSREGPLN